MPFFVTLKTALFSASLKLSLRTQKSKDPDRKGVVRTEFANVLKLDFTAHDGEHCKSILLCSCIHPFFPVNCLILSSCHVCSDIILPCLASSPKADPVSFKLLSALLYNYPKVEGKADRTAISVSNLFTPIFRLDKTSLHQGLEKLIS